MPQIQDILYRFCQRHPRSTGILVGWLVWAFLISGFLGALFGFVVIIVWGLGGLGALSGFRFFCGSGVLPGFFI